MDTKKIYLKDYKRLDFNLDSIYLEFYLGKEKTRVNSKMKFSNFQDSELKLFGEELELKYILLNGDEVKFEKTEEYLLIKDLPEEFLLEISTNIYPSKNSHLEGLYQSGDILATQNEPQGFRRITYFPDRPDVMTKFTTKLIGDKSEFPTLLSNGNLIESGEIDSEKHYAVWEDPFKKPSYLFAVVAGELDLFQDSFTTMTNRKIDLKIYTDPNKSKQAQFAMESLKKAMRWDEEKFGLEYDLDIFMIVAVDSFNMGAMENKGLNIFNSSLLLADEKTSTDSDFLAIEAVIAHEYFHNWTGNRITCRDWFQLTLKEGLTVFRDQLFSADMRDSTIQRVQDVERLRRFQYPEDSSPNAHPIKPKEYLEINNFYTFTVYEKGAEVIRMIQTILGEEGFRKGMDLYFERHDGQAVTTEDFINSMADANSQDFSGFLNWYDEKGTPELDISEKFINGKYFLRISTESKAQFPFTFSLYSKKGAILETKTVNIVGEYSFEKELSEKPVISINQNFSAPIKHNYIQILENSLFLVKNDIDLFNRYEAVQSIYLQDILNGEFKNSLEVFEAVLDSDLNDYLKSYMLKLPEVANLFDSFSENIPVEKIYQNIEKLKTEIGEKFGIQLSEILIKSKGTSETDLSQDAMGKRAIKNLALDYMNDKRLAESEYLRSNTMTEKLKALEISKSKTLFNTYLSNYSDDQEMVVKYFRIIASETDKSPISKIDEVLQSNLFDYKIPNLIRGLIGSFSRNYRFLFTKDGMELFARELEKIDSINPHISARLCETINLYPKLEKHTQKIVFSNLESFYKSKTISKNSFEILNRVFG